MQNQNPVLESTKILIENPQYVFINQDNLNKTAEKFSQQDLTIPTWESPIHLDTSHSPEEVMDYFLLANTINFAFTDFTTKQKFTSKYNGKDFRGAYGMLACLKKAHDLAIPILEGDFLKNISRQEMAAIFEGNFEIPMLKERYEIFKEVGEVLSRKYAGHFHNLVSLSQDRLFFWGMGIIERLVNDFPSFNDSTIWQGRRVCFHKRAQLAAGMLYGRFQNTEEFKMQDTEQLTIFADYVLPKALRDMGILKYEKSLAQKVDNQEIIPANSQEELEIRASTIHASQKLIEKINQIKKNPDDKVNALHIDAKLWLESRKPEGTHHHLTPTIAY
jgi:hypothetical protein